MKTKAISKILIELEKSKVDDENTLSTSSDNTYGVHFFF